MLQVEQYNAHAVEYEKWYEEHAHVYQSELSAIKMQLLKLGPNIHGIEVGMGSGRFAQPLGIKEGIEPAEELRIIAAKRGIEVMDAVAENLPYRDIHFDFVLFVTLLALDNIKLALSEAYRVLKKGGSIVIGFIEKDSKIGKLYHARRERSDFYRHATFYSAEKVDKLLKQAGFKNMNYIQTLFGDLEDIDELQSPKDGYGEGSFVVVIAQK